jgi:hypothetical protein
MDVHRLEGIGVYRFPLSRSRRLIFKGFLEIACRLVEQRVQGDLILDGSFPDWSRQVEQFVAGAQVADAPC